MDIFLPFSRNGAQDILIEDTVIIPKYLSFDLLVMLDMLFYTYLYSGILHLFYGYYIMTYYSSIMTFIIVMFSTSMIRSFIRNYRINRKI